MIQVSINEHKVSIPERWEEATYHQVNNCPVKSGNAFIDWIGFFLDIEPNNVLRSLNITDINIIIQALSFLGTAINFTKGEIKTEINLYGSVYPIPSNSIPDGVWRDIYSQDVYDDGHTSKIVIDWMVNGNYDYHRAMDIDIDQIGYLDIKRLVYSFFTINNIQVIPVSRHGAIREISYN